MKRVYDNPEFKGKSKEEWIKDNSKYGNSKHLLKSYWDNFSSDKGTSGTRIFEQDIDPSRIKGSKKYIKNSLKEVKNYIKENPGRFAKGVGKAALGTSLVAGGIYLMGRKKKNKKKKENKKKEGD